MSRSLRVGISQASHNQLYSKRKGYSRYVDQFLNTTVHNLPYWNAILPTVIQEIPRRHLKVIHIDFHSTQTYYVSVLSSNLFNAPTKMITSCADFF